MKRRTCILALLTTCLMLSGCSFSDKLGQMYGVNSATTIELHEQTANDYAFEVCESTDGYKYNVIVIDYMTTVSDKYDCFFTRTSLNSESENAVKDYFKTSITRKDADDLRSVVELRDEYSSNGENYTLYANCIEESLAMAVQSLCSGTEKERLDNFRYYLTDGLSDARKVADSFDMFASESFLSASDNYVEAYATKWSYTNMVLDFTYYDTFTDVGYKVNITQAYDGILNVLSVKKDDKDHPENNGTYSVVPSSYDELKNIGILSQILIYSQLDESVLGLSEPLKSEDRATLDYLAGELCKSIYTYYDAASADEVICDFTSADYENIYSEIDFDGDGKVTAKEEAMASIISINGTAYSLLTDLGSNLATNN